MVFDQLKASIEEMSADGPIGAALYDYQTRTGWSYQGDRWFHAASTIKVAVLAGLYAELERRDLTPGHRLHVRNRFFSVADGTAYRISPARDANAEVHAHIGRTMRLADLATHMIATSSNLATNLLVDFVGAERLRGVTSGLALHGVDFQRGVEDDRAYDAGVVNRVTADGLVALLRMIHEARFCGPERTAKMIEALAAQQFNSGIPAGLPAPVRAIARVAHKTGEISTVTHDAGIVFLPGRPAYVLAVLSETTPERPDRFERIARISGLVYEAIAAAGETAHRVTS